MAKLNHLLKMNNSSIPRPLNCFLLYRIQKQKEIVSQCPGANHRDISKIIAKWWKEATEEEKKPYREQARLEKSEHAKRYPGYRYAPKKKETRKRAYVRKNNHHVFTSRSEDNNKFMEEIYNATNPIIVPKVCVVEEATETRSCNASTTEPEPKPDTCHWNTCSSPASEETQSYAVYSSCEITEQGIYSSSSRSLPKCNYSARFATSPCMSGVSSQVSSPHLANPSLDLPADCWNPTYLPSPCSVPSHIEPYAFLSPYSIPTQTPFGSVSPMNFWTISPDESGSPVSSRDCFELENHQLVDSLPLFDLNDFPLYEPAQFIDPMLLYCADQ